MGDVIYVDFRPMDDPKEFDSGQELLNHLKSQLDEEDFEDLIWAISDWQHFQTCDPIIQDLAESYFKFCNKL